MCAHCLPHCPTFSLGGNEAESPRGRIALLKAVAEEKLLADGRLVDHIDSCLGCRACERNCPSQVRYTRLLQDGRALLAELGAASQPLAGRTLHRLLEGERPLYRAGYRLVSHLRQGRLHGAVRRSGLLQRFGLERADRLLSDEPISGKPLDQSPATGSRRGTIALFTGCSSELLEPSSRSTAIRLLNRFGYDVVIPQTQGCCGALAQSRGDRTTAEQLAEKNRHAFAHLGVDAVVSYNSGCGATLADYGESGEPLPPLVDITTLLDGVAWPVEPHAQPLSLKVAIHRPCSERHGRQQSGSLKALLDRIPGVEAVELGKGHGCCGAAGSHTLSHPLEADRLREPLVEELLTSGAELLVSGNISCARHIAVGVEEQGGTIELLSPLLLLERLLELSEAQQQPLRA